MCQNESQTLAKLTTSWFGLFRAVLSIPANRLGFAATEFHRISALDLAPIRLRQTLRSQPSMQLGNMGNGFLNAVHHFRHLEQVVLFHAGIS